MSAGGRGSRRQFLRGEDKQRVPPIDRRSLEVRLRWSARACANRAFSGAVRQAISGPPGKPSGGVRCSYGYEEDQPKRLFSPLGRIGAPRGLQSAIEFDLNKLRVFQQSHDFDPDDFIEEVLTHRPVVADRAGKPPNCLIRDIDNSGSCGLRSCRGPIEGVAALGAAHESLHEAGRHRAAGGMVFVDLQPLAASAKVSSLMSAVREWQSSRRVGAHG